MSRDRCQATENQEGERRSVLTGRQKARPFCANGMVRVRLHRCASSSHLGSPMEIEIDEEGTGNGKGRVNP